MVSVTSPVHTISGDLTFLLRFSMALLISGYIGVMCQYRLLPTDIWEQGGWAATSTRYELEVPGQLHGRAGGRSGGSPA